MTPQVTVIIPTHDRRDLLRLTLRTVLWQTGIDLEAIVVDDGSTDGTSEVVQAIDDARVRCVRQETPQGVSTARNHGMDLARGNWIAFLDDDDLWAPTKLLAQLEAAEASNATWCYTGAVKIDDRQRIVGGTPPPSPGAVMARLRSSNLVPGGCSGVVVTRRALASAGRFDPRLVNLADWDLWVRLGRTGRPTCVPEPLVGYRIHPGQASLDVRLILNEAALMDRRYGVPVDRGALHHYLAHVCLRAGRKRQSLKHFLLAASLGQVLPVGTDVWSMIRFHLAGSPSSLDPTVPHAVWRRQAQVWLRELQIHTSLST